MNAAPGVSDGLALGRRYRRTARITRYHVIAAALAALALVEAVILLQIIAAPGSWSFGMDYEYYRRVGERWLEDGTYYLPRQLAGPYEIRLMEDVLYPPPALLLFVPLSVMPAAAWWIAPLATVGFALRAWRPRVIAWPIIVALLMWPRAMGAIAYGNTDMWIAAAIAAALLWGWAGPLLVLKPVFAPFALIGIRRRGWWIAAGLLVLASIPMLPLWRDYAIAMADLEAGLDYGVGSLPLLLIPVVAWHWRSTRAGVRT